MKPKNPWAGAHVRLKRIYEARVPPDVTQKQFGERSGIGSQSMVAQYLNGIRPLNFEAAAKFARALGCTIYDICPEMADAIRDDILPFLGKALRRAAVFLLFFALQQVAPREASASVLHKQDYRDFASQFVDPITHCVAKWLSNIVRFLTGSTPVSLDVVETVT